MYYIYSVIFCLYPLAILGLCFLGYFISYLQKQGLLRKQTSLAKQSIYWKKNNVVLGAFIFVVECLLFIVLISYNQMNSISYDDLVDKIVPINNIVLSLMAIIITMAGVMIVFKKEYYLVFSIYDLLEEYNFFFYLKILVTGCLISSGITILVIGGLSVVIILSLFEIVCVLDYACSGIVFYLVFKIMFSRNTEDLKLLNKLYRIYGMENLDFSQIREEAKWKKNSIQINLDYLLGEFKESYENIKKQNIIKINYIATMGTEKERWYKKAVFVYRVSSIILFGIGIFIVPMLPGDKNIKLRNVILWQILSLIGGLIFPRLLKKDNILKGLKDVIIRFFMGEYGFYVEKENSKKRKKELFIAEVLYQNTNKKYLRYIQSAYSLIAFVEVALERKSSKKVIDDILSQYISTAYGDRNVFNVIEVLPFFLIGYIMFNKKRKVKSIKELYRKLNLHDEQRFEFQMMLCSSIYYTEKRNRIDYMNEKKADYIKWLCCE